MTNWDLIRTQYEILGKDVKELCEVHHVSSGILESAIEQGGWSVQTTTPAASPNGSKAVVPDEVPVEGDSELDKLNAEATLLHARHQNTLMPKYIEIETVFLARLKIKAGTFEEAGEAKQIADTLAIIKPSIMKQADAKSAKIAEGGLCGRIMVVNQFPVPQPGDDNYIAPNAVIVGPEAKKGIDSDFTTIEIDIPNKEDMN